MFNILRDLLWTGQFRSLFIYVQQPKHKQVYPESPGPYEVVSNCTDNQHMIC